MSREGGDWMCTACNHSNFKRRDVCQKCSCPKYASAAEIASYALNLSRTEVLAGDWYCTAMNCGAHNYASRTSCYRCGAAKPDYFGMVAPGGYVYDASNLPGYKTVQSQSQSPMIRVFALVINLSSSPPPLPPSFPACSFADVPGFIVDNV